MSETSLARAEGSVATRFSRIMKATTSPLGVLTDPAIVALATALAFVFLLASMESGASPLVVHVAQVQPWRSRWSRRRWSRWPCRGRELASSSGSPASLSRSSI